MPKMTQLVWLGGLGHLQTLDLFQHLVGPWAMVTTGYQKCSTSGSSPACANNVEKNFEIRFIRCRRTAGIISGINSVPAFRILPTATIWAAALFQVAASHSKEFHLPNWFLPVHMYVYWLRKVLHTYMCAYRPTCTTRHVRVFVCIQIYASKCMSSRQSLYCLSSWFQRNAECSTLPGVAQILFYSINISFSMKMATNVNPGLINKLLCWLITVGDIGYIPRYW